ncbi:outer membrane protein assembly factor BamB family protein [Streptomyces sp. URMC 129]|uniref:outer membrane protein assembly factor BamB family protein n=1 Tax=Streptomyces sp. URMC 129 TaxID=3423407 RepID=UPI003F1C3F69
MARKTRGGGPAVVAASVAVLLVAGGAVFMARGGDDGGTDGAGADAVAPDGEVLTGLWRTGAVPAGEPPREMAVPRVWATDDVVTGVLASGLRGYDPATGEELWALTAPDRIGAPCVAAPAPNGQGVGAVVHRDEDGACSVVSAVDTRAGELLWSLPLSAEAAGEAAVTVGDEVITVDTGSAAVVQRFSAAGEELPLPEVPGGAECGPLAEWTHSADHLLAISSCGVAGDVGQVTAFDADSGQELWTASATSEVATGPVSIVSDEPLAVLARQRVVTFGDDGRVVADAAPAEGGVGLAAAWTLAREPAVVIGGTAPHSSEYLEVLVGVDPATGEELWQRELPQFAVAIGSGDGLALALWASGTIDAPAFHLVRVAADTGRTAPEARLPADAGTPVPENAGRPAPLTVLNGTLYVLAEPRDAEGQVRIEAYRLLPE